MGSFVVLTISVLLGGCMLGPNYKRPGVDIPQAFHYQIKEAQETANTLWWKQFQDPVLDSLIAEALANNKSVKIAAAIHYTTLTLTLNEKVTPIVTVNRRNFRVHLDMRQWPGLDRYETGSKNVLR